MTSKMLWLITIITMLMQGTLFYPASLKVVEVKKGVVTMEDRRGNRYITGHHEAWEEGDRAAAIMFSNNTFDRSDDIIIQVEYAGK